jgi:hypothetical protein
MRGRPTLQRLKTLQLLRMGSDCCSTRNSSHLRKTPATRHRHNLACPQSTAPCPRAFPAAPTGSIKHPVAAALACTQAPTWGHTRVPPCQPSGLRQASSNTACCWPPQSADPAADTRSTRPAWDAGDAPFRPWQPGRRHQHRRHRCFCCRRSRRRYRSYRCRCRSSEPSDAGWLHAGPACTACRAATDRGNQRRPAPR